MERKKKERGEPRWRHRLTPEFAASNNHFKSETKRRNGHHPEPQECGLIGSPTTRRKEKHIPTLRGGAVLKSNTEVWSACRAGWWLRAQLAFSIGRESQTLSSRSGESLGTLTQTGEAGLSGFGQSKCSFLSQVCSGCGDSERQSPWGQD
uniref:Uncharacterized protein n=1 Tax=Myotis myotis TaxID=51298 RepID=A0A7J7ZWZ2_MYOMY|nr:hypothetical protein mMyoMyo1_009724 [Myotis myotis]